MRNNRLPGYAQPVRPAGLPFGGYIPTAAERFAALNPVTPPPGGSGGTAFAIPVPPRTYNVSRSVPDPTTTDLGITCAQALDGSVDVVRAVAGYFNAHGIDATQYATPGAALGGSGASANLFGQLCTAAAQQLQFNCSVSTLLDRASGANNSLATANGQISTLQGQLNSATNQNASLTGQLNAANGQISTLQGQLTTANNQLAALPTDQTSAASTISALQSQLAALQNAPKPSGITWMGVLVGAAVGVAGDEIVRRYR